MHGIFCSALFKLCGLAVQRVEVTNVTPARSVVEIDAEFGTIFSQLSDERDAEPPAE